MKPDGGSAFPIPGISGSCYVPSAYVGMTLRDYFSAAALQGLLASQHQGWTSIEGQEQTVRHAYEYADAMLKERSRILP